MDYYFVIISIYSVMITILVKAGVRAVMLSRETEKIVASGACHLLQRVFSIIQMYAL